MLFAAATLGLALLAVALLTEIWLRVFGPERSHYLYAQRHWEFEKHTNLLGLYDTATEIRIKGRTVACDRPAGKKRVICLGSSPVYGQGLADRSRAFPGVLGERFPDIEVINAGIGGYNSFQLLVFLRDLLLKLKPDLVIFYYGGTEGVGESGKEFYRRATEIVRELKARGITDPRTVKFAVGYGTSNRAALALYRLLDMSRVFLAGRQWLYDVRHPDVFFDPRLIPPPKPPDFPTVLREMATALKSVDGRLLLVSQAHNTLYPPPNDAPEDVPLIFRVPAIMAEVCAETGARCLDPVAAGAIDSDSLFVDQTHLTEEGHRRLADLVAPFVAELSQ